MPSGLVVGRQQRRAHERADLEVGDRGAGRQVRVVAGVLAEHRLLLVDALRRVRLMLSGASSSGAAERGSARGGCTAAPCGTSAGSSVWLAVLHEPGRRALPGEDLQQRVQDLRAIASIFSLLERFREISRIALSFTSGPDGGGSRGRSAWRPTCGSPVVASHPRRPWCSPPGPGHRRGDVEEDHLHVADVDPISVYEPPLLLG